MLFYLENLETGSVIYLMNKKEFLVGRKDCDILIRNDNSISREHARIQIKDNYASLTDVGSKHKTFRNREELKPNDEIILEPNDEITFGAYHVIYRFHQQQIITSATCLNPTEKETVQKDLRIIGGQYVDSWQPDCTHLTAKNLNATAKFLHAILDEKFIVTPLFWSKFSDVLIKNLPPPNVKDYIISSDEESSLPNIEIKNNSFRKLLFKNKIFIFSCDRNKKMIDDVIKKAGGKSVCWDENLYSISDIINSPKDFVVIKVPKQKETSSFKELIREWHNERRRTVYIHEIALAIMHGNCAINCNPNVDKTGMVFTTSEPVRPTQNNVLALNTESGLLSVETYSEKQCPNTISDTFDAFSLTSVNEKISIKERVEGQHSKRKADEPFGNISKILRAEGQTTSVSAHNRYEVIENSVNNLCSSNSNSNKRKVEEDARTSNKRGKTNPFSIFRKNAKNELDAPSTRTENSFSKFRELPTNVESMAKKTENPFRLTSNKFLTNVMVHRDSGMHSYAAESIRSSGGKQLETSVESTKISERRNLNESQLFWLSKNTLTEQEPQNIDPEINRFIQMFKNKVRVESSRKALRNYRLSSTQNISKGKNFKIFQKVKPMKPQTTIVPFNQSITITPCKR